VYACNEVLEKQVRSEKARNCEKVEIVSHDGPTHTANFFQPGGVLQKHGEVLEGDVHVAVAAQPPVLLDRVLAAAEGVLVYLQSRSDPDAQLGSLSRTLFLISLGLSVRKIEVFGLLADIFVWKPCRLGMKLLYIMAGFW